MTTMRPLCGSTANWMFEPPVSTPISRMTAMAASRMAWYSRSVSVCAGATVIESPVCVPMGSKFSMEQMTMTLSAKIAHHLQLVFFPAKHRLFKQHFMDGREIEAARQQFQQLFAVVGDAAAGAAERERRPQDHRETDLAAEVDAVFQIVDQRRLRHVEADGGHRVFEQQAVFGFLDGAELRADELHAVLFQHAAVGQLDREVQRRLSADGGQQGEDASPCRWRSASRLQRG